VISLFSIQQYYRTFFTKLVNIIHFKKGGVRVKKVVLFFLLTFAIAVFAVQVNYGIFEDITTTNV